MVNGYRFEATAVDAARVVIELAAGALSEDDYGAFLRQHSRQSG